jgi:hypothetical protein
MLVKGDHVVQCSLGCVKQSRKSRCKRCIMHSTLVDKTYIYGKNYKQSITPPLRRTTKDLFDKCFQVEDMKAILEELSNTAWTQV